MNNLFDTTINVTTTVLDHQTIQSRIGEMSDQLISLQEKQVKDALRSLGYLSPELTLQVIKLLECLQSALPSGDPTWDKKAISLLDKIRGQAL